MSLLAHVAAEQVCSKANRWTGPRARLDLITAVGPVLSHALTERDSTCAVRAFAEYTSVEAASF